MGDSTFRELIVFVAGATPQIVTETIYALSVQDHPVHPDDIVIITTTTGKRRISDCLVEQGILHRLAEDYQIPGLSLSEASFRIARGADGHELEDIRTEEENDAIGDLIMSVVRELASEPLTRLHCSLAGGRKTMSFYLGTALQLFGRQQDRLYHVLVPPEFESNSSFYYPPREPCTIPCRLPDGRTIEISTSSARIELAELPFIRLRGKLALRGSGFRELVAESQDDIDTASVQPEIRVNLAERTVTIGGALVEMLPVELTLYTSILRQKTDHCIYPERRHCLDCTGCYRALSQFATPQSLQEMAGDYAKIYANNRMRVEEFTARWDHKKLDLSTLRSNISKIKQAIRKQVEDSTLAAYFLVTTEKFYGGSRYGVRVDKGRIRID